VLRVIQAVKQYDLCFTDVRNVIVTEMLIQTPSATVMVWLENVWSVSTTPLMVTKRNAKSVLKVTMATLYLYPRGIVQVRCYIKRALHAVAWPGSSPL